MRLSFFPVPNPVTISTENDAFLDLARNPLEHRHPPDKALFLRRIKMMKLQNSRMRIAAIHAPFFVFAFETFRFITSDIPATFAPFFICRHVLPVVIGRAFVTALSASALPRSFVFVFPIE